MAKHLICIVALILLLVRFGFSSILFSSWSDWSRCYCNGLQERTRECFYPNNTKAPEKDCLGLDQETIMCDADDTCLSGVWNPWSEWTNCTEPCSKDFRIRVRHCTDVEHTNKTNDCLGDSVQSVPCPEINCSSSVMTSTPIGYTPVTMPFIGVWNAWSDWTTCIDSCSRGTRIRVRNCTNVEHTKLTTDCPGNSVESGPCPQINCPGVWNAWSEWTNCTESCGTSDRMRVRTCTNIEHTHLTNDCHGPSVESFPCPVINCTSLASWNDWSSWTGCTASCGGGEKYRTRECTTYDQIQAQSCKGHSFETETCNSIVCAAITTLPPRVLEPPIIYGNASTVFGGNISLICLTTIAGVSITWYYNEKESLPVNAFQPQGTGHLIITNASTHNTGTYTCIIADNELSAKAHQDVTVEETPAKIISLSVKPPHVSNGATVQIECNALGYPEPIIRWGYKDTFGNHYVPPAVIYTNEGKNIVIASYQNVLYGGTWTCNVFNKLGADHRDITI